LLEVLERVVRDMNEEYAEEGKEAKYVELRTIKCGRCGGRMLNSFDERALERGSAVIRGSARRRRMLG